MTRSPHPFERLKARLEDVLDEHVQDAEVRELRRFAAEDSTACRLVEEQRLLEASLDDALVVPLVDVPCPPVPRPVRRVTRRLSWASAAAVLVATGTFWLVVDATRSDAPAHAPAADELAEARRTTAERLVGLTAGWEVVAMRRPAEGR